MTNLKLLATALLVAGLAATPLGTLAANGKGGPALSAPPRASAVATLSDAEVATLVWMREEEKLARDMYITLNTYFPAKIFVNIAAAEQRHFDAIGKKLVLYDIADPATDVVGTFTNPDLQGVYDDLLALGMVNYVEALKVGVTIEETDLADLEAAIDGTSSVPLARTYLHLLTGSEHHLAAFTRALAKAGVVLE
jgi:hypothetical protein